MRCLFLSRNTLNWENWPHSRAGAALDYRYPGHKFANDWGLECRFLRVPGIETGNICYNPLQWWRKNGTGKMVNVRITKTNHLSKMARLSSFTAIYLWIDGCPTMVRHWRIHTKNWNILLIIRHLNGYLAPAKKCKIGPKMALWGSTGLRKLYNFKKLTKK